MKLKLKLLLLVLLACLPILACGCSTMPDEEPGYEVRLDAGAGSLGGAS
jgi:hypothetical protein